jgi:hypothetical protein
VKKTIASKNRSHDMQVEVSPEIYSSRIRDKFAAADAVWSEPRKKVGFFQRIFFPAKPRRLSVSPHEISDRIERVRTSHPAFAFESLGARMGGGSANGTVSPTRSPLRRQAS